MGRGCRWAAGVLALVIAGSAVSVAAPASACGCGAYIPDAGGASVASERALVAWDGRRQDVVMSFRVSGGSDTAAWIMPVPSEAEVALADTDLFTDLDRITAPRVEYRDDWWPTFSWLSPGGDAGDGAVGGAAPARVDVLEHRRIGPFDVTRLAAGDARALANWLGDNGFPSPAALEENLSAYVAKRWQLVAVKLVPDGGTLTGDLQPLHLSFDSESVVYPMRLSRAATSPQIVDLYILAAHRMEPEATPIAGTRPNLEYAGPLDRAAAPASLEPFLARGSYLTRWSDVIAAPENIDGDYLFAPAAADTDFRQVLYVTRHRGDLTGLLILAALGVTVSTAALLLIRAVRRSS